MYFSLINFSHTQSIMRKSIQKRGEKAIFHLLRPHIVFLAFLYSKYRIFLCDNLNSLILTKIKTVIRYTIINTINYHLPFSPNLLHVILFSNILVHSLRNIFSLWSKYTRKEESSPSSDYSKENCLNQRNTRLSGNTNIDGNTECCKRKRESIECSRQHF